MYNLNSRLRSIIIALLFVFGMIFVYLGWSMTGKISGLLIMLLGIAFFLTAILVYNKQYK